MFRKIISVFLSFIIIYGFVYAKDYEYTKFDIKADLKIDWSIDVNETLTTNFLKKKHWIIRFIPLNYNVNGTDFHIDLDYIRVDWNKFSTFVDDWWMNIKIWDPYVEIKWEKTYPIFYSVYWLIRNFASLWYTELYWNIVWYDFDTNINRVRAELKLPKKYNWFVSDDFLITTDWSTKTVREFNWNVDRSSWDKIIITYDKVLEKWEWITLAVKFPKDYFVFDHDRQASLLWKVGTAWADLSSDSVSNFSWTLFNFFSNSDFLSFLITLVIVVFGSIISPSWTSNNRSSWSYNRNSWFSSWSSFSSWWFSRGWWWGWWGSRSR